jgi:replication factor C subunit 2/4
MQDLPLIEKYRPKILDDVVGNAYMIAQLKVIAKEGNMPNLIITGPPGTGKTTSVLSMAHQMLQEYYGESLIELNASDDRGIEVVREKVKNFAQKQSTVPKNMSKIVVLDEADSMTEAAQQALRKIMTDYSSNTRFALACNDSSKIIEPIQSRCSIMRFSKLSDSDISKRLLQVIDIEKYQYEKEGIEALIFTSDGDMRYALNNLQSTIAAYGKVTQDNVFKICDIPKPGELQEIIDMCCKGDILSAAIKARTLWEAGYNLYDIIGSLSKLIQNSDKLNEKFKLEALKEVSLLKIRMAENLCTFTQLSGFLSRICLLSG